MADQSQAELPREGFVAQLIGDVLISNERLVATDSQANRRDVVRTTFAAIEGLAWDLREHVRRSAADMHDLTPMADMALREQSYVVNHQGEIVEQSRFIPLPAAIKLAVRQAKISSPDLSVDFNHHGWDALQRAIKVRNRITHPKAADDLAITDHDLSALKAGLLWLLPTIEYVMAAMNMALMTLNEEMRVLLDQLKSGNPAALAEYHAQLVADIGDR